MSITNKWLRQALLGGAALGVMASTAVAADDAATLKAQLDALQARVDQMENKAPTASLPEGASMMTFRSGSSAATRMNEYARPGERMPESRGFTIGITPTADMPVPMHEVTVSGYVKADLMYDTHNDLGTSVNPIDVTQAEANGTKSHRVDHTRLQARQSRFRIRSKSDTAIGQIRTLIETDFFGNGHGAGTLRMRHAWGEWDMTPNLTFGAGQTWSNYMNLFALPDTVDFSGPVGVMSGRRPQFRLTYTEGPMLFGIAIEDPQTGLYTWSDLNVDGIITLDETSTCSDGGICGASDRLPDLTARFQYEAPGGHKFQISGIARQLRIDKDAGAVKNDSAFAWGVLGAASVNLGDMFTLNLVGQYGDGIGRNLYGFGNAYSGYIDADGEIETIAGWGGAASVAFHLSEASTINLAYGYAALKKKDLIVDGMAQRLQTVHANYMWQPVDRFRLGAETIFAHKKVKYSGDGSKEHNLRFQLGAWFFF